MFKEGRASGRHGDRVTQAVKLRRARRSARTERLLRDRDFAIKRRDLAPPEDRGIYQDMIDELNEELARGDRDPTYADRARDRIYGHHAANHGGAHVPLDEVEPPAPPRTSSPRPRAVSRPRTRERRSPRSTRAGPDDEDGGSEPPAGPQQLTLTEVDVSARLSAIRQRLVARGGLGR